MKSDIDILNYWFEKNDLSDASRELYTIAMNQYSKIENIKHIHPFKIILY
ncbi:hypothetical protein [Methanobacterium sp. SMA-27]|nr:hypothetical protein [Methanobacterium sp. SMA-27]